MKWRDIEVVVKYNPDHYVGHGCHIFHVQVFCDEPLPITETGYKSNIMAIAELDGYESVEAFVLAWLDHEAEKPEWIKLEQESKQMTLF